MQNTVRYIAIVIAIVVFAGAKSVIGQTGTPGRAAEADQTKILRTILEEIRLLRQDTQRSAVLQATVAQLQSAQANVDSITRALQTASSRINLLREELARLQGDLKDEQNELDGNENPAERVRHERSIELMKKRLAALPDDAQQLETREKELTDELHVAQLRFNTLNKRLDDLLRQLGVP